MSSAHVLRAGMAILQVTHEMMKTSMATHGNASHALGIALLRLDRLDM